MIGAGKTFCGVCGHEVSQMKTLYFNGNIYTGDAFVGALLVEDGVIAETGPEAERSADGAERADLRGKTVIPGFNDSHLHLYGLGRYLRSVQLAGCGGVEEILERTRKFIADNHIPPGSVVTGRGWNEDYFSREKRYPIRDDLDRISAEHPIILRRVCGHVAVCNSLALKAAGIGRNTPPVPGGQILRDGAGEPNGIFTENSIEQIEAIIPPPAVPDIKDAVAAAMDRAVSYGITSVQTNDVNDDFPLIQAAYRELEREGRLKVRVTMQNCFTTLEGFRKYLEQAAVLRGSDLYRPGPLKLYADGSLGGRTALLSGPYHDDPSACGVQVMPQEEMDAFFQLAEENGLQVIVHAIGDQAVRMVVEAVKHIVAPGNPLRHGIVHAQITSEDLLEEIRKERILAFVQPIFLHYDMHIVRERVGRSLAATSYAFRRMADQGVHVSFGTDCPVEGISPFDNLYCAVTSQDLSGQPEGGFYPDGRFPVRQAVDCYTYEGAYASFEERRKGKLRKGYAADFAVLDKDIFKADPRELRHTKVLLTVMGGRVTYRADGWEASEPI